MWLEVHSHTWAPLWRIMGGSSKIHQVAPDMNIRCEHCQLWGLCRLLFDTEAWLYSRPLCTLSNDPFNPTYLSPGHFIIGKPLTQLPYVDFTDVKCNRLNRWQTHQQKPQHFWQNCSSDYLLEIQCWQRWQKTFPNPQPRDVVLLRKNKMTPLHWPMAVIISDHPEPDGIIWVVTLRATKRTFKSPTIKICAILPISSEL
jgi:hypothetical protein